MEQEIADIFWMSNDLDWVVAGFQQLQWRQISSVTSLNHASTEVQLGGIYSNQQSFTMLVSKEKRWGIVDGETVLCPALS